MSSASISVVVPKNAFSSLDFHAMESKERFGQQEFESLCSFQQNEHSKDRAHPKKCHSSVLEQQTLYYELT